MKIEKPRKPPPPARDGSLPRPFFHSDTGSLMADAAALSAEIRALQAKMKPLIEERVEMFFELERRDVSYRAMGRSCGLSTPSIIRILNRRRRGPIA